MPSTPPLIGDGLGGKFEASGSSAWARRGHAVVSDRIGARGDSQLAIRAIELGFRSISWISWIQWRLLCLFAKHFNWATAEVVRLVL